jgi:hypothetical protein
LKYLDVHCNNIDEGGALELAAYLSQPNSPIMHGCDIRYNPIGEDGGIAIVTAMKNNNNIKILDLSRSLIGDDTVEAFKNSVNTSDIGKINKSKGLEYFFFFFFFFYFFFISQQNFDLKYP